MTDAYPHAIPTDEQGRHDLLTHLAAWRKRAKPTELRTLVLGGQIDTGQPVPVAYTSTTAGNYHRCEPLCNHFAWPAARARHDLVFDAVIQMTPLNVQARGRPALQAQVYKGLMKNFAGSSVAVAVKVYQGSISKAAMRMKTSIEDDVVWRNALLPYKQEAWAYGCMQRLQGTVVPHVYGFFAVQLPSEEPAIVLIMEYVESAQLPQLDKLPIVNQEAFNDLAYGMIAATHAVTSCGVRDFDYWQQNVLWTDQKLKTGHRDVPLPVLLDFALVGENNSTSAMNSSFHNALISLCGLGVHVNVLYTWWEAYIVRNRHFPRLFDVLDGALDRKPDSDDPDWCLVE